MICGVVRWLKAEKRTSTFWPTRTRSMSLGCRRASICSSSWSGTISMMTSAGEITPPIAWAASWCTTPETGSYIDPVEEAARRDAALGELGLLVLRFAQILRHLAADDLIDAHHL